MKKVALVCLAAVVLSSCSNMVGKGAHGEPLIIYRAPDDDPNIQQWHEDWTKITDSINEVRVITNLHNELFVDIEYLHSHDQGHSSLCGGLVNRESGASWWGCRPQSLHVGRGWVTLKLSLSPDRARKIECTDQLYINLYKSSPESVESGESRHLFKQTFDFEKKWLNAENPSVLDQIKARFTPCPDKLDKPIQTEQLARGRLLPSQG